MRQRIRIGLAGAGRMGQVHAASLSARCPAAELACVFDADADKPGELFNNTGQESR